MKIDRQAIRYFAILLAFLAAIILLDGNGRFIAMGATMMIVVAFVGHILRINK